MKCVLCGEEIKHEGALLDHAHGRDRGLFEATLITEHPGWSGRMVWVDPPPPGRIVFSKPMSPLGRFPTTVWLGPLAKPAVRFLGWLSRKWPRWFA